MQQNAKVMKGLTSSPATSNQNDPPLSTFGGGGGAMEGVQVNTQQKAGTNTPALGVTLG